MRYAIALSMAIIIILTCLTGCWNRKELNELAIVVALGLDQVEDQYLVTAQILNPSQIFSQQGGNGSQTPIIIFYATGDTLAEAFRKVTLRFSRRIDLSDLKMVIVGESLARKGFTNSIDFLARNHELRRDYFFAIAKGRAAKIIKTLTSIEKIPADKLYKSLEVNSKEWGMTSKKTLDEVITEMALDGKQLTLTSVHLEGDPQTGMSTKQFEKTDLPTTTKYFGTSIFDKDQLVGWLNEEESLGLNYSQNKISNTIVNVPCSANNTIGTIGIELIHFQSEIKTKMENGKPRGDISIQTKGNIQDVACSEDISKAQTIHMLEKRVEQSVKHSVFLAIQRSQKQLHKDIFGFGEELHQSQPSLWKKIKKNWEKSFFVNMPIHVSVDITLQSVGGTVKPIEEIIKE